jgi:transcription termination/antitermination protein NusA
MASLIYQQIDALSREKGIDPQIVVSAVEDAMVVATRKSLKTMENLRAELDKESGAISVYAVKTVVETPEQVEDPNAQITLEEARKTHPDIEVGGEIREPRAKHEMSNPAGLGRISAQLAKQVIFQKVREAERDTVYNEYIGRVNEIVTAGVKRIEGPDVIFELGKTEARMPRKEQSRLESFAPGERVRVVIARVEKASKGPQVIVSRAAPELVQHLFQTEVPEIYDNTVVIRAIAREAGERTKIAVMSRDKDVDSVGACVGMKGMRVQSIIRELRGEKIDIIEYHEDPVTFAEKALQPAKVSRVSVLDAADKHLEVIVDDSQLSLAIGKKGQNVRLAAKLLGWKIDIKSEEEKRQEVEQQMTALVGGPTTPLEKVSGLGEGLVEKLAEAGITTVEALADMTPEQLEEIPGIGPKTVEKISIAVNNYFSSLEAGEAPAEAQAPAEGETVPLPEDMGMGAAEAEAGPEKAGQAGETQGLSDVAEMAPESVEELVETGQDLEAAAISGVENAPTADVAEVETHAEHPDESDIPEEKQ